MAFFTNLANKAADVALSNLKEKILNPAILGIGTITKIAYADKSLRMTLLLNGLEDREIEVQCSSISIADDGSQITLSDFSSNREFAETLLNMFCTKTFDVPDKPGVRMGLVGAKKILGL